MEKTLHLVWENQINMLDIYNSTEKAMRNKSTNPAQRKTTLKWNANGELSSIDMTRIINDLSIRELKECELACNSVFRNKKKLNLGICW